jgi:uncharacterized OB-fold protein
MEPTEVLLPEIDEDGEPFWQGTAAGELRMQACGECNRRRFPPRPMCPHCHSTSVTWERMSGHGTIWSLAVPHPPVLPVFAPFTPFAAVIVALDEDPALRLVGNLLAEASAPIDSIDPATIVIGEPVSVVFVPIGEGVHLPQWVRAVSSGATPSAMTSNARP